MDSGWVNKTIAAIYADAGIYAGAGIYGQCWYLRSMVVFTDNADAGIYGQCWYLRTTLVFTLHAGIYAPWLYLHSWYYR